MGTRNVPREVREREMVAVARRLFARRGYEDVSMAEIARGAGVSKPLVYAYFESKERLFLACIEQATLELMHELEEATPPDLPPDVRLWRGLLAVFTFIERSRETWSVLHPAGAQAEGRFAAGAARANEAMTGLITRLLCDAAVAGGIDRRVAHEATEPLAHGLVAAVQGVAAWWHEHPDEPKERTALRMMNFAWMGLDNLVAGRLWLPPADGDVSPGRTPGAVRSIDTAARTQRLTEALEQDRDGVLDQVFQGMVERYDPGRAGDVDAVVEWRVRGRPDGGLDRFQLVIAHGVCRLERDAGAEPSVIFTIDANDFLQLVAGGVHGPALFTSGRLRVDGDMMLAARVPGFFARRPG